MTEIFKETFGQLEKLNETSFLTFRMVLSSDVEAQWLINLEIPVLVRSLKSSNVELG